MSLQQDRILALQYALAKQVPAMERGFSIRTSYGEITIPPTYAPGVIKAVRKALEQQLAAIQKQLATLQQGGQQ